MLVLHLGCWLFAGCVDQPVCMAPLGSTVQVQRLSQLGIFAGDLAQQTPAPGVTPYEVNVALYSDRAYKHRFAIVPAGAQLHFAPDRWELPLGTRLVKTFYYPTDMRDPSRGGQLIETRVLTREGDGLRAGTYVWNPEQTDAFCSGGNLDVPTHFTDLEGEAHLDHFHVPGTSQCQTCHDNLALGLRTRQMNKDGAFTDGSVNQIDHLHALGVLDSAPPERAKLVDPESDAPLDQRARAYLDANCGHCHRPGGQAAPTRLFLDLDSADPGICRHTPEVDGATRVIVPGHPESSELLARMRASDPFVRMPRGPTHIPDGLGLALLTQWIAAMTPMDCP